MTVTEAMATFGKTRIQIYWAMGRIGVYAQRVIRGGVGRGGAIHLSRSQVEKLKQYFEEQNQPVEKPAGSKEKEHSQES